MPVGPEPTPLPPGAMLFIGSHAAVFRFVSEQDLQAIEQELASPLTPVASTSPDLARRCFVLRQLARGNEDLLIVGETGVGKEQFARAIHQASGRAGKFVAINCPALPGTLIESELFGYTRGAHSQAARDKPGLIDEADGGTLFLDEFAEISQEVQAKLLRFLEEKEFQPLGSTRTRKANVRVLAATNRELRALRQDITARLGPEPIRLPPLREHLEDIAALASHFLRDRPGLGLEVPAFQAVCQGQWPDNVRGLRKALTRAADLAVAQASPAITLAHLPDNLRDPARHPWRRDHRRPRRDARRWPAHQSSPGPHPAQPPRRPHQGRTGGTAGPQRLGRFPRRPGDRPRPRRGLALGQTLRAGRRSRTRLTPSPLARSPTTSESEQPGFRVRPLPAWRRPRSGCGTRSGGSWNGRTRCGCWRSGDPCRSPRP